MPEVRVTMRFHVGAALLVALVLCLTLVAVGHARSSAPVAGDCSWAEHGEVIHIDGAEYHCVCGRLTGPNGPEIRCQWHLVAQAETRRVRHAKHAAKPKARYGIGTAVLAS